MEEEEEEEEAMLENNARRKNSLLFARIPVARLQIHLFLPSGFIPFWSHLDSFKDLKIRFPLGTRTRKMPYQR